MGNIKSCNAGAGNSDSLMCWRLSPDFLCFGWETDSSYCYIPECCLRKSFALCRIHHTYTLSLQIFFAQGYDQVFSGSLRNCYFVDFVTSIQLARDQNLPWSEFLSTTKSSRGPVYFLKFALYNQNSTSMYQSCTNCTRKEVMYLYRKPVFLMTKSSKISVASLFSPTYKFPDSHLSATEIKCVINIINTYKLTYTPTAGSGLTETSLWMFALLRHYDINLYWLDSPEHDVV